MALLLMLLSQYHRLSTRGWVALAGSVVAIVVAFSLIFREVLSVPLPGGALF